MFATHRPVIWSMCHRTEGPYHMDQTSSVPGAGAAGLDGAGEGAVGLDLGRGCPV